LEERQKEGETFRMKHPKIEKERDIRRNTTYRKKRMTFKT
jgi:hypothetical protein